MALQEEKTFLDGINSNPDDDTVRLVYADWLDEHDRPDEATAARSRAGVAAGVRALAAEVRAYALAQKALWQQVPYWALQADGRTGWNARYAVAYSSGYWGGYWGVDGGPSDYRIVTVDLETGELGHDNYYNGTEKPSWRAASDHECVRVAPYIGHLDASALLTGMRAQVAKYPDRNRPSFYTQEQWVEAEQKRRTLLAKGHITPTSYHRRT